MESLTKLKEHASTLELDAAQRLALRAEIVEYGEVFLEKLQSLPVYRPEEENAGSIMDSPFAEQPADIHEVLGLLKDHVENSGVNLGAAGHMAFIPVSTLYTAALGDYLAAVLNRYAGLYFASPGAVRMERMLLRWMADMVGYPASSSGDLTSGGSMANLVAIVTAREAHQLKSRNFSRAVAYMTEQTHHSVEKALRIAGLGECIQTRIPMDENYHMQPAVLDSAIRSDKKTGRIPWLIVASAGTTDTGAVDLLPVIGEVAQHHQLWLHVDGAYGGMFALCLSGQKILKGIELSHSLIMDPHKGLFMPCGSGVVLVRNGEDLLRAHHYQANYMQDSEKLASPDELSPADLSPELTRPFRGLRLWLSLKLLGVASFRAALEEKIMLAKYFHQQIQLAKGFEAGPRPDLSIVTFRYQPRRGDANDFNQRLVLAIQKDGRIFISSTNIDGKVTLRLAILSHNTHLETVNLAIELLKQKAAELEGGEE